MTDKIFCVYHKVDFDGKCAAAIVLMKHPDAELVPYNYGDDIDPEKFRGHRVIMVDCSLQPFSRMLELAAICDLMWIDHHKTAIEEYEKATEKFPAHIDSKFAGCELTWQWAFPEAAKMPRAVWLLGRYDVWDMEADLDVLPMQYGLRLHDMQPRDIMWQALMKGSRGDSLETVIEDGRKILQYVQEFNRNLCHSCFEVTFDGLKCICLNAPRTNSQVYDSVFDPAKHDAMLSYFNSGNRYWTVTFYTTKPGVDVGAVAKARGGGGHMQAAGFQIKDLPVELKP